MRTRVLFLTLLTAGALSAPAHAATFRAHLKAPNHRPKAGSKHWIIKVTARTASGKALHATAIYKFLYNGQVVSTQCVAPFKPRCKGHRPYPFTGSYRDAIRWPKRAVGFPLKFRVVVTVKGRGTKNLDWKVRVHK